MKNIFTFQNYNISIESVLSDEKETKADLIISNETEINTKTFITVIRPNSSFLICFQWYDISRINSCQTYISEQKNILYFGAGNISAVIDIDQQKLIHINYPEIFWKFIKYESFVLELGELTCRLYSEDGKFVDETSVDPPYDYEIFNDTVEFDSPVHGKTKIVIKR